MTKRNPVRVAFLDQDGTIIVDREYLYRIEDVEFLPGAVRGLQTLTRMGFALVIVSNQSGVARGVYTEDDVRKVHAHLKDLLLAQRVKMRAFLYCPHLPEGTVSDYAIACDCRKPAIGMATQAEHLLGPIDYEESWAIGDKPSDVEFGQRCGTRTALIRSRYWKVVPEPSPTLVVNSLQIAVESIERYEI